MHKLFLLVFVLFFLPHCGRKNNNFLVFEQKLKEEKINKLTLPATRRVSVKKLSSEILVTWQAIENLTQEQELLGYNLYRFVRSAFIPRDPLNKKPIKITEYTDSIQRKPTCYAVRAVFLIRNKTIEGPLSKIVCVR